MIRNVFGFISVQQIFKINFETSQFDPFSQTSSLYHLQINFNFTKKSRKSNRKWLKKRQIKKATWKLLITNYMASIAIQKRNRIFNFISFSKAPFRAGKTIILYFSFNLPEKLQSSAMGNKKEARGRGYKGNEELLIMT